MNLRPALSTLRDLAASALPFVLLASLLLALAYWWLDPMPPRTVTLATGPARSAYDELGQRYARALAAQGITVRLRSTEGSRDNLRLLQEGAVDIGFVQGGSSEAGARADEGLLALGQLFVEPIWLFYREEAARRSQRSAVGALTELQGWRLDVGPAGSGAAQLMQRLFEINRIDPARLQLSQLQQTQAVMALLDGRIDALVLVSAPESLMVQMLLQTPGIRLMDFSQSEAYARRLPFLSPVTLPRGVVDLAADVPPQDVRLLATTTTLLAREQVHPALVQLFAQAALQLHGSPGWFQRAREFPRLGASEYPLAAAAERTLQNGVPWLQRHLPFIWANLLERMWLALGLVVAVALPLSRIVPPLYQFRVRSRVFRWYAQLRAIEERLYDGATPRAQLLQELDALDARVGRIRVPLAYASELYALRNHIELVRRHLRSG
ncbi:MAG: TAXI family TRAP transporter solute-binding subunit [Hylemonella sp.]